MLDSNLAEMYGVDKRRLNEQVKRNITRFPQEFMFQINESEFDSIRSQNATFDEKELYHIGASLKDLGKKWFAFSKMNADTLALLKRINEKV